MDLRSIVVSYGVAVLVAGLAVSLVPPTPVASVAALVAGAVGGLLLSRWVILPYLGASLPSVR